MLEWELLAVFVRRETHGWYRTVIAMVGFDALAGVFIVVGAGWLRCSHGVRRRAFRRKCRRGWSRLSCCAPCAWLLGDYMSRASGVAIAIPLDGFVQAVLAAALGIPYFRWSRRVRETFIDA